MGASIGRVAVFVVMLGGPAACGPGVAVTGDDGDSTGRPGGSSGVTSSVPGSLDGGSGMATGSGGASESTGAAGEGETGCREDGSGGDDGGGGYFECDLWAEDCPCGEKCMPYANDGIQTWHATRCSPIAPDPRARGESCTVQGAYSGIDDCELHTMCWNVDPASGTGVCVAMCGGTEENPNCENNCESCIVPSDGVQALCIVPCDPLVPATCDEDYVCVPSANASFHCRAQSGDHDGVGAACGHFRDCDPGLFCAEAGSVPSCEGPRCCAPYCNPAAADTCDALLPGTTCVPWHDAGEWPAEGCASAPPGRCIAI